VAFSVFLPNAAEAFWPFSDNASAATASDSPSPTLLSAAVNYDPNPHKGLTDVQIVSDNALVAPHGPSGSLADVASSTPPDRISVYVVRKGDTLSDIAKMFNVSVNTIIWANNLSGVKDVHVGDTLVILPVSGIEYTVKKGDTLKSLAKKYSADAEEIAKYNGLDLSDLLAVGVKIMIPGGEIAAAPKPASGPGPEPYLGGGGAAQPGYYSNPVPGGHITQGIHGKNGVDIGLASGAPIRAAADGTVIVARGNGAWNGGYGNYVVISHANGTQTLYAHLKSVLVSPGQSVSDGQVIGYMGATGKAFGTHLHFEVRGAANPFRNCRVGSVCSPQ
jgi:murein DD-endopeptidase MepM/ murein hydrolase activator NlpD